MQAQEQVICLPTGDGMVLIFFTDPEAPTRFALKLSAALQSFSQYKLRIGIHSGPVNRVIDVNHRENVAGAGINMAQRVMDCGDAGHILVSKRVADDLAQYTRWQQYLHDLGEVRVKHGELLHLFNLYTDTEGNSVRPTKFQANKATTAKRTSARRIVLISAGALLLGIIGLLILARAWKTTSPPPVVAGGILHYWVQVQKYRDGVPEGPRSRLIREPEEGFQGGEHVWLNVASPQAGHLYVIYESPVRLKFPQYTFLFPSQTANNNSSALAANQSSRVPDSRGFLIDAKNDTVKVWIIWSAQRVKALEAIAKEVVTMERQGVVNNDVQAGMIQEFIREHATAKPEAARDEANKLLVLRSTSDVMITLRLLTLNRPL
jgi:hypothetical protein